MAAMTSCELRSLHHDVTAIMLVLQSNEMAAILLYRIIPVGFKFFPFMLTLSFVRYVQD